MLGQRQWVCTCCYVQTLQFAASDDTALAEAEIANPTVKATAHFSAAIGGTERRTRQSYKQERQTTESTLEYERRVPRGP